MKPRGTCSFIVATVSLLASAQSYNLPASGRFVLESSASREIFHQCSRQAPTPKGELWVPSAVELNELEDALLKYLQQREKSGKESPPMKVSYHRQYVGFRRGTERYVYGNFYPPGGGVTGYESKNAVIICDGGPAFWGIVYNVKTKSFEEPHFNGVA